MFQKVNPRQSFPEMENEMNKFWTKNDIFQKSIDERSDKNKYVFYDGPPFITGMPHYGSLLPRIAKDVVPRYWTMNGKRVDRQWGWDCHGLPIENKVEKKLGLKNRRDIEKLGIQEFVDQCYSYTREISAEWKWYKEKIGQWVDFDNSYKTMDQDYMESVIWMFKELYNKNLIYEGTRTSLFCTRCGTPVSNFEIAMDNSYKDMEDPAVAVKFKVTTEGKFKGMKILAWTTTPWTLPANKALVLDPEATYVVFTTMGDEVKNIFSDNEEKLIAAKPLLEALTIGVPFTVVEEVLGKELLNLEYEPLFNYFPALEPDYKTYAFPEMVHMNEGTGIVHSAPGFGEVDSEMGKSNKIKFALTVNDEGKFVDEVTDYKGMYIKDADDIITSDLQKRGLLFKSERITHRFPFCYRCETPLIQKAQPSWFIDIQSMKPLLVKNNENINWVPDHLKYGRFKKGIETAPDWCISRTRYWATPMPLWQRVENGKVVEKMVIGSRDELRDNSTTPVTKIMFVRHADFDTSVLDGELSETGWSQVEALKEKLADEKFDAIYTSSMKRSLQTADEIAAHLGLETEAVPEFGSVEQREKSLDAEANLKVSLKIENILDADEAELKKHYQDILLTIKAKLDEILEKNKGKYVLVITHEEELAFLRAIIEGRNLKETMAMKFDFTGSTTIYFNGTELLDLHRPKIDKIKLKGKTGELERVPEVLDVWMDSASMPYASKHYPFENKKSFEENYPADFIVEYIAQTRAWFYVMHVISSALFGTNSFKNVVTTGVIFGTDGRKMSKSYGNYPDPKKVLETYGAEALRLSLMGSKIMVGEDMNMDEEGIKDQIKTILLPLWNSYSFFVTYANLHNWKPTEILATNIRKDNPDTAHIRWDHIPFDKVENNLDQWIIAKLQLTIRDYKISMEEYNIPAAVREIPKFIDDLSKWYIRRSRDRFAAGDNDALSTLYYVLVEFAKMISPVAPFVSEALYQNLVVTDLIDQPKSVHLCNFPHPDIKFMEASDKIMLQMSKVRAIVALGQSLRVQNGLKVRQPLSEIEVLAEIEAKSDYDFTDWMKGLIMEELNVKKVDEKHELSEYPGWLRAKDESTQVEISLDTNLSIELQREGQFRELTRKIQNIRKLIGLQMGDKIELSLSTSDAEMSTMLESYKPEFAKSVGALSVQINKGELKNGKELMINNVSIMSEIKKI